MCLTKNDIETLDDAQRIVNEASFDQNWLVYGPAGTGKTIIALNRVERMHRMRPEDLTVYVSKSKVLGRWVEQAAADLGIRENIKTFDRFFWNFIGGIIGREPFKLVEGPSWSEIDWERTLPLLKTAYESNPELSKINLVLDEAQDLHLGFFSACKLMCRSVFVVMDENQKTGVWADSSRIEVSRVLGIDKAHQRLLNVNYRNPKEIKDLSECFYEGDKSELAKIAPIELRRNLEAPPTIRWLPFSDQAVSIDQVRRIIQYCCDRPTVTVCVVTPNKDSVNRVMQVIKESSENEARINQRKDWSVRGYTSQKFIRVDLDMCSPGVIVSNSINFKGSEYDAVFMVDWEYSDESNASMYTAITRARGRIEVLAGTSEAAREKIRKIFEAALNDQLISEE
jgi:DNA helicase IV